MSGWMDFFNNPRGHALKKTMFDILQERYSNNEAIIERLGASLITESDSNAFLKLIVDVYEAAYIKAVDDQREELAKVGLSAKIVPRL